MTKRKTSVRYERHGKRHLPEYQLWIQMKGRCFNKRNKRYKYYGERGITVCDRWARSFQAFYDDMGPRPAGESKMTVERMDNNGNYEPGNCCWATCMVQARNKRNNIIVNGVVLKDACKGGAVAYHTAKGRIKRGWNSKEAVTKICDGTRTNTRWITVDGKQMSLAAAARMFRLHPKTLRTRIVAGWDIDAALNTPPRKWPSQIDGTPVCH